MKSFEIWKIPGICSATLTMIDLPHLDIYVIAEVFDDAGKPFFSLNGSWECSLSNFEVGELRFYDGELTMDSLQVLNYWSYNHDPTPYKASCWSNCSSWCGGKLIHTTIIIETKIIFIIQAPLSPMIFLKIIAGVGSQHFSSCVSSNHHWR